MAILERVKIHPQQRYDLEDFEAALAMLRTDANYWHKRVFSDTNKILAGFVVTGLNATSATITMAGSTVVVPENTTDYSFWTAPAGMANETIAAADLADNTRNYVEFRLVSEDGTPATKAFWDPEANDGDGAEFQQEVNTATAVTVEFSVNQVGFTGGNYVPVAILDTDNSGVIKAIFDQRPMFGRLAIPSDIDNDYAWGTKNEPTYTLVLGTISGTFDSTGIIAVGPETATFVSWSSPTLVVQAPSGIAFTVGDSVTQASTSASGVILTISESFTGVDKSLNTLEDILKAMMTEIKAVKGTRFWWTDASTDLESIALDLIIPNQDRNAALVEGGVWAAVYNAGAYDLTWTADAYIQIPGLTIGRNTLDADTISLPNATSVAWVEINRDAGVNDSLTVTVQDIDDVVISDEKYIFARRVVGGVQVGIGDKVFFVAPNLSYKNIHLPNWSTAQLVGSGFSLAGADRVALCALSATDVAYFDDGLGELRTYRFNGSTWALVGSGFAIATTDRPALTALSSSTVAFVDNGIQELRKYSFNGTNWSLVGSGLAISGAGNPDFRIAALGANRVALIDDINEELRTYDFDGSNWSQTGNGLSIAGIAEPALAALNSTTVAFIDATLESLRAYEFDGTEWTLVGSGLSIAGIAEPALTAINGTDVVFIDSTLEQLRVYRFNGSTWTQVSGNLTISGIGRVAIAAIDGQSVAFVDATLEELRLYRFGVHISQGPYGLRLEG